MSDDFFPETPKNKKNYLNEEDTEGEGLFPTIINLSTDTENRDITPTTDNLKSYNLTELEEKIAVQEIEDCDSYLKTLHRSVPLVTSVNSLLKVVNGCLGIHKHRREVLNQLKGKKENKGTSWVVTDEGNVVPTED